VVSLCFFVGKGGVGKTTVSSAFAVHQALKSRKARVLLISTDPAHSLADVFNQKLGPKPTKVKLARTQLSAWQVDVESRFRRFLNQEREQILSILESGSIFTRADIAPLLDTALPGMAEMAALLAIHDAMKSRSYDHIVVDTAPFGHTLRMLEMPEHFVRFLDFLELASSRDQVLAEHFGGAARLTGAGLIAKWRKIAEEVSCAFSKRARIFLVTTPEPFSLQEAVRCRDILRQERPEFEISDVVLNRVVDRPSHCRSCGARSKAATRARRFIRKEFPGVEVRIAEDPGAPIIGTDGLIKFGAHLFSGKLLRWKPRSPSSESLRLQSADWPILDQPLSLVLGKGGVGKTTISAGLGFQTRAKTGFPVEICSVDPAPSLDDVFQSEINDVSTEVLGDGQFLASEMDAALVFRRWVTEIKAMLDEPASGEGIHVDLWFERRLFSQLLDSVPPGLDEVLAVFRITDLAAEKHKRVVIDMAPTGHALDLLRTPDRILAWTRLLLKTLAAHRTLAIVRDAGMKVAELGQRVRELLELIRDPKQTRIAVVMLAEPLPDRETERLMRSLEHLNVKSGCLFVNRLNMTGRSRCPRCNLARSWQMFTLAKLLQRQPDLHPYVVENFSSEIAGKKGMRTLTKQLWRVS